MPKPCSNAKMRGENTAFSIFCTIKQTREDGGVVAAFRQFIDLMPPPHCGPFGKQLRRKSDKLKFGWGGRIRTCECRYQKPVPYHLATPQSEAKDKALGALPQEVVNVNSAAG